MTVGYADGITRLRHAQIDAVLGNLSICFFGNLHIASQFPEKPVPQGKLLKVGDGTRDADGDAATDRLFITFEQVLFAQFNQIPDDRLAVHLGAFAEIGGALCAGG